jgi:hypothetical protein
VANPADRPLSRQITVICEVLSEPASHGRLVGRARVVLTGELVPLTSVADLIELVRRLSRLHDPADDTAGAVPAE